MRTRCLTGEGFYRLPCFQVRTHLIWLCGFFVSLFCFRFTIFLVACLYLVIFWDWVSLHSPNCPGTGYVDQVDLEFTETRLLCLLHSGIKDMYHSAQQIYFVFIYMYMCVCVWVSVCECWCPWRTEEGARLAGGYEPAGRGAGNWVRVLCKSGVCA